MAELLFPAGLQQELYFLPSALEALAAERPGGRTAVEALEARIEEEGLSDEHLEGLGLFGTPEEVDGYPAIADWSAIRPRMAEDCLEQLRQLEFVDGEDRITPEGRLCMKRKRALRRAFRSRYSVTGRDDVPRTVAGRLRKVRKAIEEFGSEDEDVPWSARYRPALCLAEFMRFHFWLSEADARKKDETGKKDIPSPAKFAGMIVDDREEALKGLDADEGGIEYAALVMADAAADRVEKDHAPDAAQIAAARSSALMLCDAGVLVPDGFPGGVQWLLPVHTRKTGSGKKKPAGGQ